MAVPTNIVANSFTLTLSAAGGSSPVEYQCEIASFEELTTETGGEVVYTACGPYRNPITSTVTGIKVNFLQGKDATSLFRRLRETPSAGTEVMTYSGNATITEATGKPEWTANISGWTIPPLKVTAQGAAPTTEVTFTGTFAPGTADTT